MNLDSSKLIFIIGYARSGTSFIGDALNTSKEIYILTELFLH